MASVLPKVKSVLKDLHGSERHIAELILHDPLFFIEHSIKDVAEKSNSSAASVSRFVRKLGFKDFKAFKIAIVQNLAEYEHDKDYARANDSVLTRTTNLNIQTLKESLELLNIETIDQIATILKTAGRIDFFAQSASYIIALDAHQKWLRTGKHVSSFADSHVQLVAATTLTPNDVAFIISYSGMTRELVDIARIAKKRGATVIALTRNVETELSKAADILIKISATQPLFVSGSMASRLSQINAMDILYNHYIEKYSDETTPLMVSTYTAVQTHKYT